MSEAHVSPAAAPTYPTYPAHPYEPDGRAPMAGAMALIFGVIIAGAAMGYAVFLVSKLIYFILIFPVLIGLGLGFVGARMTRSGRVRNPFIGGFAGLLAAVVAMTMVHYFRYREFQVEAQAIDSEAREIARLPQAEQEQIINESKDHDLVREILAAARVDSFLSYIDYQATMGVEIKGKGGGSSGSGLNLGYTGTYIYWCVELLVVAGITYAMVRKQARQPFCEPCMLWKPMNRMGRLLGDPTAVTASAYQGNATALAAAAHAARDVGGDIELSMATCENCKQSSTDLRVEHVVKQGDKQQRKTLAEVRWPAEAVPVVQSMFTPRMTSDDPPPAPPAPPAPPVAT
jgi:hypothetical protein